MNVEFGAEAALFPEKEYMNGIAVAVHTQTNIHAYRQTYLQRHVIARGGGGGGEKVF